MQIRTMIDTDLPELSLLYEQFWGEKSSLDKMKDMFNKLRANNDYILLSAIQDNKVVGSAMGVVCHELYGECRPFMVIEDFIVDNNVRRKGIGTGLMKELENRARDHNCCNILLVTESNRTDAQSFYESTGFKADTHRGYKKSL